MPQAIHISPIDNVVVALHPIAKGNGAQCGSARDGAVVYTVLQGESLNEHHPAYEYYQKREHRPTELPSHIAGAGFEPTTFGL